MRIIFVCLCFSVSFGAIAECRLECETYYIGFEIYTVCNTVCTAPTEPIDPLPGDPPGSGADPENPDIPQTIQERCDRVESRTITLEDPLMYTSESLAISTSNFSRGRWGNWMGVNVRVVGLRESEQLEALWTFNSYDKKTLPVSPGSRFIAGTETKTPHKESSFFIKVYGTATCGGDVYPLIEDQIDSVFKPGGTHYSRTPQYTARLNDGERSHFKTSCAEVRWTFKDSYTETFQATGGIDLEILSFQFGFSESQTKTVSATFIAPKDKKASVWMRPYRDTYRTTKYHYNFQGLKVIDDSGYLFRAYEAPDLQIDGDCQ